MKERRNACESLLSISCVTYVCAHTAARCLLIMQQLCTALYILIAAYLNRTVNTDGIFLTVVTCHWLNEFPYNLLQVAIISMLQFKLM